MNGKKRHQPGWENRHLGRRDPGPFPLLPKCDECGHHIPSVPLRDDLLAHWPWCSQAEPWQKALWERGEKLRELRTIKRLPSRGLS